MQLKHLLILFAFFPLFAFAQKQPGGLPYTPSSQNYHGTDSLATYQFLSPNGQWPYIMTRAIWNAKMGVFTKHYIDSVSHFTFSNGLTNTSGVVGLGGSFNQQTLINTNGNLVGFTDNTNGINSILALVPGGGSGFGIGSLHFGTSLSLDSISINLQSQPLSGSQSNVIIDTSGVRISIGGNIAGVDSLKEFYLGNQKKGIFIADFKDNIGLTSTVNYHRNGGSLAYAQNALVDSVAKAKADSVKGTLPGAITLHTTGNSGASTLVGPVLNVPNYTLDGLGGLALTGGTLTGNVIQNGGHYFQSLDGGEFIAQNSAGTLYGAVSQTGLTVLGTGGSFAQNALTSVYNVGGNTLTLSAGTVIGGNTLTYPSNTTGTFAVRSDITSALTDYQPLSEKGANNGYASLDGSGKVPLSQINSALLGAVNYQGNYNAATNTPALPTAATANKGYYWVVNVAGTFSGLDLNPGDWVISNGVTYGAVYNNNAVTSVNGMVGAVDLSGTYYTKTQSDVRYPNSSFSSLASNDALRYNGSTWINSPILASSPLSWAPTTYTMSIQQASTSQSGYLSATDWNTFNSKVSSTVTSLPSLTSAAGGTFGSNAFNSIAYLPLTAGSGSPLSGTLYGTKLNFGTGTFTDGTNGLIIGPYAGGGALGAIYRAGDIEGADNYKFVASENDTYLNAVDNINLHIGNVLVGRVTSSGIAITGDINISKAGTSRIFNGSNATDNISIDGAANTTIRYYNGSSFSTVGVFNNTGLTITGDLNISHTTTLNTSLNGLLTTTNGVVSNAVANTDYLTPSYTGFQPLENQRLSTTDAPTFSDIETTGSVHLNNGIVSNNAGYLSIIGHAGVDFYTNDGPSRPLILSDNNTTATGTLAAQNFYTTSATPTAVLISGTTGTGATISISGTNQSGIITLTTGVTGIIAVGALFTVTNSGGFSFPNSNVVVVNPVTGTGIGAIGLNNFIQNQTATSWQLYSTGSGGIPLSPSTVYVWNYINSGY